MSQGLTLAQLVQRVKVLCGDSTQEGSAVNNDIATLLALTQESLANTNDWASLETIEDVTVSAGTRTGTFPSLNLARPIRVEYKWTTLWHPLDFGIGADQYNAWEENEQSDPIERWKLLPLADSVQSFEVWPTPTTDAVIRFTGQIAVAPFAVDSDVCTVDALLLAYYTAAERMAILGKKESALMLGKANALAASLRSVEHRENNVISFTKYSDEPQETRAKFVRILNV